uniref:Transmembrane protein n=1 Tax=viral metagenome TaxID=1070528 RepID=A0A6C0D1Y1_9ZZZZ
MSKKSQELQLLKKRHEKLLQVIVSIIPSLSRIRLQQPLRQSFVMSHPLKKVYDGESYQYEQSIKKTIRDYLHNVYDIESPEEDLINRIYMKFREKEDIVPKIPIRQQVFKFLDPSILAALKGEEGPLRQTVTNIESEKVYHQKKAVQDMINYLKIKLKLKTLKVETANIRNFYGVHQIYGIPIPIPHDEEETAIQLLQKEDFPSLFEKYRRSSSESENLILEPIRIEKSDGNDEDQFILVLGKIDQPYQLDSRNGLIRFIDEKNDKKDMVQDLYFNRIVNPTLSKERGFKHRFMVQQPYLEGLLSEAIRQNNFLIVSQLSPYLEPSTLYKEYKNLPQHLQWAYLRYFEEMVLNSMSNIAIQQKDPATLYKIWRRLYSVGFQSYKNMGKTILLLFDTDVLCHIIKETNSKEESNSGLITLFFRAIESNLFLTAIKIIRQLDSTNHSELWQYVTRKLYKENKVDQFLLENKEELSSDEISIIRNVTTWKFIFLIIHTLGVLLLCVILIYVAIFLNDRYGKMVMGVFILCSTFVLYNVVGRLWSAIYIAMYIIILLFKYISKLV